MGKHLSPATVGIFVLGAFAIGIGALVILASGRLFSKTYRCVLFFQGDVNGLRVGAPVKFRGVEVGTVTRILLTLDETGENRHQTTPKLLNISIPVIIELDENRILRHGYVISDPKATINMLIDHGLRGQLAMESLVTGLLYVALDMLPNSPAHFVLEQPSRYQEIPTTPTEYEKAQSALSHFAAQLDKLDLGQLSATSDKLMQQTTATAQTIQQFFASPELKQTMAELPVATRNLNQTALRTQALMLDLQRQTAALAPGLRAGTDSATAAMKEAQGTFAAMRSVMAPNSPLDYQLLKTLRDLSAAAVATRQLANYLQRNPSVLLRGKAISQEQ
jgi:paraquat-inducible protein B